MNMCRGAKKSRQLGNGKSKGREPKQNPKTQKSAIGKYSELFGVFGITSSHAHFETFRNINKHSEIFVSFSYFFLVSANPMYGPTRGAESWHNRFRPGEKPW